MAKLTLSDLSSLQNETTAIALVNANNALIETALENTLSRDGTAPNAMGANLDMNSHRIINLPEPVSGQEAATKDYVDGVIEAVVEFPDFSPLTAPLFDDDDNEDNFIPVYNQDAAEWQRIDLATIVGRVLRPEQFGAVGDGVTDDHAAWVLLAAATTDNSIIVADREYKIAGRVEFTANNLCFNLTGAIFRQYTAFTQTFKFTGANAPAIKGGTFYGYANTQIPSTPTEYNGASSSYNGVAALFFSVCDNVEVEGVTCYNHAGGDIQLRDTPVSHISHCLLDGIGGDYINPLDNGSDFGIEAYAITNVDWVYVYNWHDNVIRNHAFGALSTTSKSFTFHGNTVGPCWGQHGVYGIENDGMSMIGNTFIDCFQLGIKMQHENYAGTLYTGASAWTTAHAYVVGDEVRQNTNLYECLTSHTSGTFATDLAASKWQLSDKMHRKGGSISGNTAIRCGAMVGIIETTGSFLKEEYILGLNITGNTAIDCLQDAFNLDRCIDLNIADNVIENPARYGMYFKNSSGRISGNTIRGADSCGMFGSLVQDTWISDNLVIDCGLLGPTNTDQTPIYLANADALTKQPSADTTPTVTLENNTVSFTTGDAASTSLMFFDTTYQMKIFNTKTNSSKTPDVDGTVVKQFNNEFSGFADSSMNGTGNSLSLASLNITAGGATPINGWMLHSANVLSLATATTERLFFGTGALTPATDNGYSLGDATLGWGGLYFASGAALRFANTNWVATHSSGILTVGTGDLRVTTAGTNSASVVTVGGTQTLTNKTFTTPSITVNDNAFTVQDDGDTTKKIAFQVSGISTGTTRTFTFPNVTDTLVTLTASQTLTNKTLTSPSFTTSMLFDSGFVMNWNAGNYTLTHSAGNLTAAGGPFTAPAFIPSGSTVPSVGFYLSSATNLSFAVASTARIHIGTAAMIPATDDGMSLGDATHNFSDLFLATGALINIANSNWVATHSSGILTISTGDLRVTTAGTNSASVVTVGGTQTLTAKTLTAATATTSFTPTSNDGAALGSTSLQFSDLFLASGAVLNIANGDWAATHTTGILTVGTGDLRVTTAGTNTASVVTVGGTQTLTNKTLTSPTMTSPTLGAASATSITFSSTTGVVGTTTNNNAAAGSVGEYISSTLAAGSALSLTTNVIQDVTSISLTAGDWDVYGNASFNAAATTVISYAQIWISTTSATLPTAPNDGAIASQQGGQAGIGLTVIAGRIRMSLSGTTTVYLSGRSAFTVSSNGMYGFIGARRVR